MKVINGFSAQKPTEGTPFEYNLWTGVSFASARNAWMECWMAKTKASFDSKAMELRKNETLISLLVDLYVEAYRVSLISFEISSY